MRLPHNVRGLAEKVYNLTPDFLFKNKDDCVEVNDVPHDEGFLGSITSGAFTGGLLHLA